MFSKKKGRKLPFRASPYPAPKDIQGVIDSIMIEPQSMGSLNGGSYSKENNYLNLELVISAIRKELVDVEKKLLGSKDYHTVIYEVSNYNDSPVYVYVKKITKD